MAHCSITQSHDRIAYLVKHGLLQNTPQSVANFLLTTEGPFSLSLSLSVASCLGGFVHPSDCPFRPARQVKALPLFPSCVVVCLPCWLCASPFGPLAFWPFARAYNCSAFCPLACRIAGPRGRDVVVWCQSVCHLSISHMSSVSVVCACVYLCTGRLGKNASGRMAR